MENMNSPLYRLVLVSSIYICTDVYKITTCVDNCGTIWGLTFNIFKGKTAYKKKHWITLVCRTKYYVLVHL